MCRKKLNVGDYKWKEICEIMGWKTTGGNYKKAKLKELESICEFRRSGNTYIITKIYDKPKEIVDNRGKQGIFIDDISDLILYECSELSENNLSIDLSSSMLSFKLGMINFNYIETKFLKTQFSEKYNIPRTNLEEYFKNIRDRNTSRITTALNKLMNKGLIVWNWSYNIKHKKGYSVQATDEEISAILDAQNYVLENSQIFKDCEKDLKKVYLKGLSQLFFKKVKEYLNENGYEYIEYYFKAFHIITSEKFRKIALENKIQVKDNLNQKIIESFLEKFKENEKEAKLFAELCLDTKCEVNLKEKLKDIKVEKDNTEINLEMLEELLVL